MSGGALLAGLGERFIASGYHSLCATPDAMSGFYVTAVTHDPSGPTIATAIEDPVRRRWAFQFHPESILTAAGRTGYQVIDKAFALAYATAPAARSRWPVRNHGWLSAEVRR